MYNKITQQERLLKELWKGKVNSYSATYSMRIKQAPTRIRELREKGYKIISIPKNDKSVDWELEDKMQSKDNDKLKSPAYTWVFEDGFAREVPVNQQQQLI